MAHPKPVKIPKNPGWLTQILVLRTLMGRQIRSRMSGYHLGLIWIIVEPLTSVLIIGIVIGSLAQRTVPEIPYPFFLLNGMMLLQLFNSCMNAGMNASSGKGMLVYQSVKPLDPYMARFLFQFLSSMVSYIIFCLVAIGIGVDFSFGQLHIVLICFLVTWCMGSGLGLILAVSVAHVPELEKMVTFLQRPLLFVSAVLLPSSAMSSNTRSILMWNPLVHTIELARNALFPYYNPMEANLLYPTMIALGVVSMGLVMFRNNRLFLLSR